MRRVGLTIKKHTDDPVVPRKEIPAPIPTEDRTRAQLIAELESRGISYPKRATKTELLSILKMGLVLEDPDEILPDPEE